MKCAETLFIFHLRFEPDFVFHVSSGANFLSNVAAVISKQGTFILIFLILIKSYGHIGSHPRYYAVLYMSCFLLKFVCMMLYQLTLSLFSMALLTFHSWFWFWLYMFRRVEKHSLAMVRSGLQSAASSSRCLSLQFAMQLTVALGCQDAWWKSWVSIWCCFSWSLINFPP